MPKSNFAAQAMKVLYTQVNLFMYGVIILPKVVDLDFDCLQSCHVSGFPARLGGFFNLLAGKNKWSFLGGLEGRGGKNTDRLMVNIGHEPGSISVPFGGTISNIHF